MRNETLSGTRSPSAAPHPDYDRGSLRYDQQAVPWAQLILAVMISRLAGGDIVQCCQSWAGLGGRRATRLEPSQRKLSLSSRDDPNYKDINAVAGAARRYALMRSRPTSPGASLPSGRCLSAVRGWDTSVPRDRRWRKRRPRIDLLQKPNSRLPGHVGAVMYGPAAVVEVVESNRRRWAPGCDGVAVGARWRQTVACPHGGKGQQGVGAS